ncbi:MAG: Geranylgeranyl diphosphate synthase [uncultured Chloroflexi bacterium]|uniref:Geranylgeranyl diphosphate synthase n=1 Tax=uncultured Chloroflexota bacterium TaxID=166587 RepID=A0A6J4IGF8_9CHLR|nr:MAG: Geranylgeranyl diphosphate synthase [uncultured Chloroflexota bacterium]
MPPPNAPAHYGMMRYHLGWVNERLSPAQAPTGKRLRPLICLLAAQACGAQPERVVPAAVALELLHNFTLIHDDIEDGDAVRHHRPTVWKVWGEPQAINAGDGMHVLAHLALLELAAGGVPAARVISLATQLAQTSLVITEGQHLDLAFEQRDDVTPDAYLDMIGRKSAALIACSASMGGEVAGAGADTCAALAAFGFDLGMGFQIRDDVLGIWGRSETTGKPAGDLRRRKKTLPSLYAMSRAAGDDHAVLPRLFATPAPDDALVGAALAVLDRQDARAYCERKVERYSASARGHLTALSPSRARDALDALIAQLETREF